MLLVLMEVADHKSTETVKNERITVINFDESGAHCCGC